MALGAGGFQGPHLVSYSFHTHLWILLLWPERDAVCPKELTHQWGDSTPLSQCSVVRTLGSDPGSPLRPKLLTRTWVPNPFRVHPVRQPLPRGRMQAGRRGAGGTQGVTCPGPADSAGAAGKARAGRGAHWRPQGGAHLGACGPAAAGPAQVPWSRSRGLRGAPAAQAAKWTNLRWAWVRGRGGPEGPAPAEHGPEALRGPSSRAETKGWRAAAGAPRHPVSLTLARLQPDRKQP